LPPGDVKIALGEAEFRNVGREPKTGADTPAEGRLREGGDRTKRRRRRPGTFAAGDRAARTDRRLKLMGVSGLNASRSTTPAKLAPYCWLACAFVLRRKGGREIRPDSRSNLKIVPGPWISTRKNFDRSALPVVVEEDGLAPPAGPRHHGVPRRRALSPSHRLLAADAAGRALRAPSCWIFRPRRTVRSRI